MQAVLDRKKKTIELKGSLAALERMEKALLQQRQECLEEIEKIDGRMRKKNARKRSASSNHSRSFPVPLPEKVNSPLQ